MKIVISTKQEHKDRTGLHIFPDSSADIMEAVQKSRLKGHKAIYVYFPQFSDQNVKELMISPDVLQALLNLASESIDVNIE